MLFEIILYLNFSIPIELEDVIALKQKKKINVTSTSSDKGEMEIINVTKKNKYQSFEEFEEEKEEMTSF